MGADAPGTASSRFASSRILHFAIGGGLLAASAAFVYLRNVADVKPLAGDGGSTRMIAYVMSALAVVQMGVAYFVFKPKVPQRTLGHSLEEYWSADVATKSLVVWAILEAAGMVAATGYFLTGEIAPALVGAVAIVLYWISGPGSFANG